MDKTWIKHIESATAGNRTGWLYPGGYPLPRASPSIPECIKVTLLGGPKQGFDPPAIAQHIRVLQQLDMLPQVNPKLGGCIIPFTTRHGYLLLLHAVICCYCQLLIGSPRLLHFVSLRDLICMASSCFIYELLRTPHGSAWNIKWVPYMATIKAFFPTRVIFKLH